MTQYIDKSALIAQIERIQNTTMDKNKNFTSSYDEGMFDALTLLENYIDTLEVKEADLEKEFDKCCENYIFDDECEVYTAKRFFELGLSVKNPNSSKKMISIDKAAEWLKDNTMVQLNLDFGNFQLVREFVDHFKEAMHE